MSTTTVSIRIEKDSQLPKVLEALQETLSPEEWQDFQNELATMFKDHDFVVMDLKKEDDGEMGVSFKGFKSDETRPL